MMHAGGNPRLCTWEDVSDGDHIEAGNEYRSHPLVIYWSVRFTGPK
jgi:hypothetical protein